MHKDIPNRKFTKVCPVCTDSFSVTNNAQVYCSMKCRSKRQYSAGQQTPNWKNTPKNCRECAKEFIIPEGSSPNRAYCSEACQIAGYSKHTRSFKNKNPGIMKEYNERRRLKYGIRDTVIERLYKKYPDLPKCCEAVGCCEGRVIDIAHKPEHKRNGAYRTMKVFERHMFWILCPTHHALIDRGVLAPADIGLK